MAQKLKSSIKVKRELQEEEYRATQTSHDDIFESFWGSEEKEKEKKVEKSKIVLIENLDQHIIYSLEYFLSVNNPILGLVFYTTHKKGTGENTSINIILKLIFLKIYRNKGAYEEIVN